MNINHYLNQVLPVFNSLNQEFSLGFQLVDIFSDHFSFNIINYKDNKVRTDYYNKLKNIYQSSSNSLNIMFIIFDASVKNNITITISYIQKKYNIIVIIFAVLKNCINFNNN